MASFGDRIRIERERRGWSQRELARRVGVTGAYISLLETGQRGDPGRDALSGLARAFDMTIDALLAGTWEDAFDRPPVEIYRALGRPERYLADLNRRWADLSLAERTRRWRLAQLLYTKQQELAEHQRLAEATEHQIAVLQGELDQLDQVGHVAAERPPGGAETQRAG